MSLSFDPDGKSTSIPRIDHKCHSVQFYDEEKFVNNALCQSIAQNLNNGNAVLLFASQGNCQSIENQLQSMHVDVKFFIKKKQFQMFDAEETCSNFMNGNLPDEMKFTKYVGSIIDSANKHFPAVRVYGEMVNLLWIDGKMEAAVALEVLWESLLKTRDFTLHCSYLMQNFCHVEDRLLFNEICLLHTHVIPTESYGMIGGNEDQLRYIAQLQQQALILQTELRKKQEIEVSLRLQKIDLKKARDSLEKAHRTDHFRRLAEAMPQLVWTARSDAVIEYCNQRWIEYTGLCLANDNNCSWILAVDAEDREQVQQAWNAAVESKAVFAIEHRIIRKIDNQSRWHLTRATPHYNEEGEIIRWFGTNTEIHEQKELQEELARARDTAENANQAKTNFLANMSHEIRTPIAAILGFSDLLRENSLPQKDRVSFVETIARNGRELVCLIDDILDLSKVEAGRLDVEKIKISLSGLLSDVTTSLGVKAREKGLYLKVESGPSVPDIILSDPTRLRQILINIIGNAIKFTDAGGISVQLQLLPKKSSEDTYKIAFMIQDTGRGISAAELERLFKPFSQADNSTTRKFGGTGLGLVLSRRLAQLLGGDLELTHSQLDLGSLFTLTIDIGSVLKHHALNGDAPYGHSSEKDQSKSPSLENIRILLADDAPDNRFLIERVLTSNGALVDAVENGAAALQSANKKSYDVVLMDMQMPVLDGFEATRRMREAGFTKPIIALTAYAMRDDQKLCLNVGCNEYLTKPLDYRRLIEAVAQYGKSKDSMSNGHGSYQH